MRLLARLVRLFPAPFRDRFAAEILDHLEHDLAGTSGSGRLVRSRLVVRAAIDLLQGAAAEWLRPSWSPHTTSKKERTMRQILAAWLGDLRHAGRTLRRTPAFTGMAIGTLALAIGALAGMFAVVNTVLLAPLPYANPDRLVYIAASAPGSEMPDEFGVSSEFYFQYGEESRLLEGVALYGWYTNSFRDGDRVERIWMSTPTNSIYATLGVAPILGRLPVAEDGDRVFVSSHRLWQSWFGGDSAVVGRIFEVGGQPRELIGVMGPEFAFPNADVQLWTSNPMRAEGIQPGRFGANMVGRMAPGVTIDELTAELNALASRLPERFGGTARYAEIIAQHRAVARPILAQFLGTASRALWILLASAGIVLLIACANVANLFVVRAEGRTRDLAVRRAIGATRSQLVRLQLAEAFVVALGAGVLAVGFALLILPIFLRAAPPGIPRLAEVGFGLPSLGFTLAAVVLAAVACGLVPALRASAPDLQRLRDGGRTSTGRHHWIRNALVVGQTALALVLLVGSGLLMRSFQQLRSVDPGYDIADVFTFQFAPEQERLADGPSWARFHLDFLQRLAALPGVSSVGIVENVPLNEGTITVPLRTEAMGSDPDAGVQLNLTFAAGDYFRTMAIDVEAGRTFVDQDHLQAPLHAVVSQTAAGQLWPGQDPVGQRIQLPLNPVAWATVIGVVADVKQDDFRQQPTGLVYLPLSGPAPDSWALSSPAYVVKTPRAGTIAPEIRELVRQVAPEAPMYRTFTMAELAADSMVQLSFTMLTLGLVSILALVLGAVGLYAVLSYLVAERTREIGVRMALGASAERVRRMVVVQGAKVVGIGIAIGLVVAALATRLLDRLLFGVGGLDLVTFAGVALLMVVIGVVASYLPARRASQVDPIWSMRSE